MNMWRAVWKIEARKTVPWYVVILLVLTGYTLFRFKPLGAGDLAPIALGSLQGVVLALRIFRESSGTAAFVFSRPVSRRRLFLYRWGLGLGLQALSLVVVGGLIVLGVRQTIQTRAFDSPWYPMVRWYELSVLLAMGLPSLFFYQVTCFVMLRNRLLASMRARRTARWKRIGKAAALWGLLGFALFTIAATGRAVDVDGGGSNWTSLALTPGEIFRVYLGVLVAMTTLGGLRCYSLLEIEA